jgi:hypothetical protein
MTVNWAQTGYCTNVHAGADFETTRANLQRYALAVKNAVCPREPMGIGLWLSAAAAGKLLGDGQTGAFAAWLSGVGLVPYTFNGFPYGDFHQTVVKHRVYEPTWWQPERLRYTLDLIAIQDELLPAGMAGSISTLPLAWGNPRPSQENLRQAAANLRTVAGRLARLERETGRFICLCLEPEPGCFIQRSGDLVQFFENYLLRDGDGEVSRRYLRVCHDVCHAVVMFEGQADVFRAYQAAGIGVGKVQVSSAVCMPMDGLDEAEKATALAQLVTFREERYLHQTVVWSSKGETFFEDLPAALQTVGEPSRAGGEWRVHFHVPIYLKSFGRLVGSQRAILECLAAARRYADVDHFEVETYAWGVLPEELRQPDLAAGIAEEMRWFAAVRARSGESQ